MKEIRWWHPLVMIFIVLSVVYALMAVIGSALPQPSNADAAQETERSETVIQYVRSPDSAVHVVNQAGDGEFTFCDRDITQADSGGFIGIYSQGPATCLACKEAVDEFRASVKGVRWEARL